VGISVGGAAGAVGGSGVGEGGICVAVGVAVSAGLAEGRLHPASEMTSTRVRKTNTGRLFFIFLPPLPEL
jgi:hypothetical protein